ncbi:MAG: isochorismatase family protein [Bacteroidales bacterium]|nr:isochorismatase family protein [Bacteroidales bacterium]
MPNKMLIIVDPQNDFISGTLPVAGAEDAMLGLCDYLSRNPEKYDLIIVTADRHPADHCSFATRGGQWPVHCVKDSDGAAVFEPLARVLDTCTAPTVVIGKGQNAEREEYSVFTAPENSETIIRLAREHDIDQIDVCGLAGDYCVLATLTDGIERFGHEPFTVLLSYSPSIDGGTRLADFITENSLKSEK